MSDRNGKSIAVSPHEFPALVERMITTYRQGTGGDVEGIALDCRYLLDQSPLISVGKIKKPGEPTDMLTVLCKAAVPILAADEVAAELVRYWDSELRFPFFAAHSIEESDAGVVLHFITVRSNNGPYVMGKIVVDLRPSKVRGSM